MLRNSLLLSVSVIALFATHSLAGFSNWQTYYKAGLEVSVDPFRRADAESMYQAALRDAQFFCVPENDITPVLLALADLQCKKGQPMQAIQLYERVLKIYRSNGDGRSQEASDCAQKLMQCKNALSQNQT